MAPHNNKHTVTTLSPLLNGLDPTQRQAVTSLSGPLLVVAGPGSGKTRMLTHRIAALVESGVRPANILAVTFTNKAAAEMRERTHALLDDTDTAGMWICTFHSACVRILRSHAAVISRSSSFTIADATDARRILKKLVSGQVAEPDALARELQNQISLAKNQLLQPDALYGPKWHPQLAHWWRAYQDVLAAQQLLDFDDLLVGALHVLQDEQVAAQYRERFTHILVDEFQDTNACQYAILKILGAHNNICVVGDSDQSIYSWRGAAPAMMQAFTTDWPDADVVTLGTNYRSTPQIVEFVAAVMNPSPSPMRANQEPAAADGMPVRELQAYNDLEEASTIATLIATSTHPLQEHAVIYRTRAQSRLFEQALRDRGVPFQVVGGVSFFENAEVKDALAYLKAAANPFDRLSLSRAAAVPRRGLGDKALADWFTLADTHSVDPLTAFADFGDWLTTRTRSAVEKFVADMVTVQEAFIQGPDVAVDAVLAIPQFVDSAISRDGDAITRKENLEELAVSARTFLQGTTVAYPIDMLDSLTSQERAQAFLENVTLLTGDATTAQSCQLMTAHASKGREFDVVYVAGAEQDLFPHSSATSLDDVEEERRLFFVACSRARRELVVSHCHQRFRFKDVSNPLPSPFLQPVSDLLVPLTPGSSNRRSSWSRMGTPATGYRKNQHNRAKSPARKATPPAVPPSPSTPSPRLDPSVLCQGLRVRHDLYGEGVVETFDTEVVYIKFATGTRTLMLAFAPLSVV